MALQEASTESADPDPHGVRTTRLAPSPTGDLHLGNARTFFLNWALARHLGWRVLLRHEDLDETRVAPETRDRIERSLAWLGTDWDGPAKPRVVYAVEGSVGTIFLNNPAKHNALDLRGYLELPDVAAAVSAHSDVPTPTLYCTVFIF